MISQQIARLVANVSIFFELCDDNILDPDIANDVMETLVADLQSIDKTFLRELVAAFGVISPEYKDEIAQFVRDIPYAFYLEETIAADDPVMLAKLAARRDADDTFAA